jgi:bacillithiol synthase
VGRTFSSSFLADEPAARGFLARDFRDADARRAGARAAAARRVSPVLVEVLRAQQGDLAPSAARDANLDALAAGDTAVVATGQQVGLFLGPLYSFYKAASAIAAARALAAESGVRCIPLFWLQTEDHDFAEIATCHVADDAGVPVTLALAPETATAARVSLAQRTLGAEVTACADALAEALGSSAFAAEVVALLRAHYVPGRSPARAFAGVLATIFADEGLLILDPRDTRLAALATPLYRRALDDAEALEAGLQARVAALAAAGFDEQIPVRAGCSLLFFHSGGVGGPRYRLQRPSAGAWSLAGTDERVADAEVRRLLETEPLRFSTSALLRPLVQDTLLPTVAYVGGPAEVSYCAQLPPLYAAFGVAAPLVIPRARFRVLDAGTRRRLEALGLVADDVTRPRAELLARVAAGPEAGAPVPEALRRHVADEVAPVVDALTRAVAAADAGLLRAAERTRETVARALGRFVERYARDLAARDGTRAARLDKVLRALAPEGIPQERFYAWPSLAARHGIEPFKRLVLERLAAKPFTTTIQELEP